MKKVFKLIFALAFSLLLSGHLFAEDRDFSNLPDNQLYEEEANTRIQQFEASVNSLKANLEQLDQQITKLKKDIEQAKQDYADCHKNLLGLLDATDQDIKDFRQKFGVLNGKVREMKSKSDVQLNESLDKIDELEKELNALRGIKIAVMREFYDKIIATANDIRELRRRGENAQVSKKYIVRSWAIYHDCLWNISKNPEIYGDALLWPKIWQANTDIIKNPDLIHPGDELTIPKAGPKTDEELKAERRYWRRKASMMRASSDEKGNQ